MAAGRVSRPEGEKGEGPDSGLSVPETWAPSSLYEHAPAETSVIRASDLWTFQGEVGRRPYVFWAFVLFFVKHNLDRAICLAFGKASSALAMPFLMLGQLFAVRGEIPGALALSLVATALPFALAGSALTLRRLRSANLPPGLVALFFVPFVNLLLFALLAFLPEKQTALPADAELEEPPGMLDRVIPTSALGSAMAASFLPIPLSILATLVSVKVFQAYGSALFVAWPFCLGYMAAVIHGYQRPRSLKDSVGVALLASLLSGGAIFLTAVEGVMCLLMAAPLALPLAMLGGGVGHLCQRGRWRRDALPATTLVLAATMPLLMGMEGRGPRVDPGYQVTTALLVDAPPEVVWRHVVSFPPLPEPEDWLFRTGLAVPLRAEIQGEGPGAVRHCVFSTGTFVEPIEVWDPPHLLRFAVTASPPPMQEWSPYPGIHPPHLDGYMVSVRGQFQMRAREGGGTELEGTTWYRHGLGPSWYWRLFSDAILHRIHLRVLKHVKRLSEASAG